MSQISDPRLRREISDAIGVLKKRQRLGLVFEEHFPETDAIYGLGARPGSLVRLRTDPNALWRVNKVEGGGRVAIVGLDGNGEKTVSSKDLLTVLRLGDPVFPCLSPLGKLTRANKPFHAIINGENYHALQLLVNLFEGKVDCIYADPPYNTGARDWRYNNHYVDANDVWRHSKWLSMMEKRLKIAKKLLKPDGVLIITIDQHELHHLGMLLERLFPESLRYMVTSVINPKGTDEANFRRVEEQILFVVPDTGRSIILGAPVTDAKSDQLTLDDLDAEEEDEIEDDESDEEDSEFHSPPRAKDEWEYQLARRRGSNSYRRQRPKMFFPIFIDEKAEKVIRTGQPIPLDQSPSVKQIDGLRPIWPIDSHGLDRCWRFGPRTMQTEIDAGNILLGKYNEARDSWTINVRRPRKLVTKLKTVWLNKSHDAGTHGTELLRRLLGEPGLFPFPKSVYAVRDCLASVVGNRPNALIVDFFAGSGTTFHATCLLNAADGGRRRSILVTNNEVSKEDADRLNKEGKFVGDQEFEKYGIFWRVTRPRCEAVVTGKQPDGSPIPGNHLDASGKSKGRPFSSGFDESIEFFQLDYLESDEIELRRRFKDILPSLWLAAGGVGERELPSGETDFIVPRGSTYGVLFKESRFKRFKETLEKRPEITHAWLVTDSDDAFAEMHSELPRYVQTFMLYRDYFAGLRVGSGRGQ